MHRLREHARLIVVVAAVAAVVLATFLVFQALEVTLLADPEPLLDGGGVGAAAIGVALLIADALVVVPSSLVMISLGALYGFGVGMLLALVGRFGMAVLGLALGRAGAPIFAKLIGEPRRRYAESLLDRWGAFALVVSRPVPILAETVALTAGAARLPWRVALPAAFVGSVPEAVIYAALGATAASTAYGALVWVAFLVVGTLFRLAELRQRRSQTRSTTSTASASTAGM